MKEKIEGAKKELEEALKGEDFGKIKEKMEALQKALEEIGASMYKGKGAEGNPGQGASGPQGSDVGPE